MSVDDAAVWARHWVRVVGVVEPLLRMQKGLVAVVALEEKKTLDIAGISIIRL